MRHAATFALLSLAIVNIPLVTTLGYTSALVVAIAVTAAITLLPALLAIVGDRIDRLHLPLPGAKHDGKAHGWRRWAEIVARRPWPAAIIALVILGVLALPILDLYLGQQDNAAMPKSTDSRHASDSEGTRSSSPPRPWARIDTASCTSTFTEPTHEEGESNPRSEPTSA